MRYYLDTEFLEGPQDKRSTNNTAKITGVAFILLAIFSLFFTTHPIIKTGLAIFNACLGVLYILLGIDKAITKPTIDLISIGIVSEDDREYYAISKDFNLKEAWNRFQMKEIKTNDTGDIRDWVTSETKEYWIRENILKPIFDELIQKEYDLVQKMNRLGVANSGEVKDKFTYRRFKKLLAKYGKTNKEIAEEIKEFCLVGSLNEIKAVDILKGKDNDFWRVKNPPKFFAYYCSYDWVVFCWVFGKMIELPDGFPMYCVDIKQIMDEKANTLTTKQLTDFEFGEGVMKHDVYEPLNNIEVDYTKVDLLKKHKDYPVNKNPHHALSDAKFDRDLHKLLIEL